MKSPVGEVAFATVAAVAVNDLGISIAISRTMFEKRTQRTLTPVLGKALIAWRIDDSNHSVLTVLLYTTIQPNWILGLDFDLVGLILLYG